MRHTRSFLFSLLAFFLLLPAGAQTLNTDYARDPAQPVDEAYSASIAKYTTDPAFLPAIVAKLPASKTVPTPAKVLGDVAGAPDKLPYAEEVYKYFRLLEASSPRVKVFSIGKSEEGREMIAAAIADPELLKGARENSARLAQLADPRTIKMDDAQAAKLIDASYPVYYITGTIHSPETGAPTALMELAYRLAVDNSPYIRQIRSHMIVLITPVVEVDGRDRQVDIYRWHKAHPNENYPRLMYWGHYVAHDNNRDAMGMTLQLTRHVLDTYLDWHAQVLHDLHESVPFLYDNTVGDGPYNAWLDPILSDEWAELGWNNVAQMQAQGTPGVFTHGDFDTWSPGYLMFLASMHNGISRLYETFGNGGADTEKRILEPEDYSRTWYRQNPPYPQVIWSQRNNNNYEQAALLTTLSYFSQHTRHFLENYYKKSKRSIEKPSTEGPVAYVLPIAPAEKTRAVELLKVLKLQHVELSQLTESATITLPAEKHDDKDADKGKEQPGEKHDEKSADKRDEKPKQQALAAGTVVIRLDQPFSRVADALLDRQFWAPDDAQHHPYDDTGWSFPHLFNVQAIRVTDAKFLSTKMEPLADPATLAGTSTGAGSIALVANSGQPTLLSLVYRLKDAHIEATEKPLDLSGQHYAAGSLMISSADDSKLTAALRDLALDAVRIAAAPAVATHPVSAPRIAVMHTWLSTQTEGWWRQALDQEGIPFDYISTQTVAKTADLRAKYDAILFGPIGRSSALEILDGMPSWGNPLPWQKSELTPNLGLIDSTSDMRPGLGYEGLAHLKAFVEKGGLLVASDDAARFAIDMGLAPGVSYEQGHESRVTGSVLNAMLLEQPSPITAGFGATLAVLSAEGMTFGVSDTVGGGRHRMLMDPYEQRPTGRGSQDDSDTPQARKPVAADPHEKGKPWQPRKLNEEQLRNNPEVIPAALRPEVLVRFSDPKSLLLDGLLDKPGSIAERPIVVNAHLGAGSVLLFAANPLYRGMTIGNYALVFNAILEHDHLARPAAPETKP